MNSLEQFYQQGYQDFVSGRSQRVRIEAGKVIWQRDGDHFDKHDPAGERKKCWAYWSGWLLGEEKKAKGEAV